MSKKLNPFKRPLDWFSTRVHLWLCTQTQTKCQYLLLRLIWRSDLTVIIGHTTDRIKYNWLLTNVDIHKVDKQYKCNKKKNKYCNLIISQICQGQIFPLRTINTPKHKNKNKIIEYFSVLLHECCKVLLFDYVMKTNDKLRVQSLIIECVFNLH